MSKRTNRVSSNNRLNPVFFVITALMLLSFSTGSMAYNNNMDGNRGHQWIIRKAIQTMKSCPQRVDHDWRYLYQCPDYLANDFDLAQYEDVLFKGAHYADHNPHRCYWYVGGFDLEWVIKDGVCDVNHHYCEAGHLEAGLIYGDEITIAKPGVGTPEYAQHLFDLAGEILARGNQAGFCEIEKDPRRMDQGNRRPHPSTAHATRIRALQQSVAGVDQGIRV